MSSQAAMVAVAALHEDALALSSAARDRLWHEWQQSRLHADIRRRGRSGTALAPLEPAMDVTTSTSTSISSSSATRPPSVPVLSSPSPSEEQLRHNLSMFTKAVQLWRHYLEETGTPSDTDTVEALEGRVLALLDGSGRILAMHVHALPVFAPQLDAEARWRLLASDAVFESWWTTQTMARSLCAHNAALAPAAAFLGDTASKAMPSSSPSEGAYMMVEVALALSHSARGGAVLRVADASAYALVPSALQSLALLTALNAWSGRHAASLAAHGAPTAVVASIFFALLRVQAMGGAVTRVVYRRRLKRLMAMATPYLDILADRGMTPETLGLRALLIGPETVILKD